MEPRREGFERERYVPERNVEREGVQRERTAEPYIARPSEPAATYYDDRQGVLDPGIVLRSRDLTRWGPVIGGFLAALSLTVLLAVLGAAIGFQVAGQAQPGAAAPTTDTGIAAAVWGAITLIVSFFVGGWLAGRTAAIAGSLVGLIHGFCVWTLTVTALLLVGALGLAGAVGSLMGTGMMPGVPGGVSTASLAGWGTFVALALGLCAALFGGWVGGQNVPEQHRLSR